MIYKMVLLITLFAHHAGFAAAADKTEPVIIYMWGDDNKPIYDAAGFLITLNGKAAWIGTDWLGLKGYWQIPAEGMEQLRQRMPNGKFYANRAVDPLKNWALWSFPALAQVEAQQSSP